MTFFPPFLGELDSCRRPFPSVPEAETRKNIRVAITYTRTTCLESRFLVFWKGNVLSYIHGSSRRIMSLLSWRCFLGEVCGKRFPGPMGKKKRHFKPELPDASAVGYFWCILTPCWGTYFEKFRTLFTLVHVILDCICIQRSVSVFLLTLFILHPLFLSNFQGQIPDWRWSGWSNDVNQFSSLSLSLERKTPISSHEKGAFDGRRRSTGQERESKSAGNRFPFKISNITSFALIYPFCPQKSAKILKYGLNLGRARLCK